MPMEVRKTLKLDNIEISNASGTLPYHTSPYTYCIWQIKNYIYTTTHIRTKDIDHQNIKKLEYLYNFNSPLYKF